MKWSKLYNPLMLWLLRSPLHGVVSSMYMVVNFTGRKSGKAYSTPVEYWQDGDTLMFFTTRSRVWLALELGGARATWPALVPRVIPRMVPRA